MIFFNLLVSHRIYNFKAIQSFDVQFGEAQLILFVEMTKL